MCAPGPSYASHRHDKVGTWRETHPRFHFHVTPTYSSRLNRVESWSSTWRCKVLDRGSFDDLALAALHATLGRYVRDHNRQTTPLRWNVTADAVLTS